LVFIRFSFSEILGGSDCVLVYFVKIPVAKMSRKLHPKCKSLSLALKQMDKIFSPPQQVLTKAMLSLASFGGDGMVRAICWAW